MKGEYDVKLPWPFKMKVKFTVIDEQKDPVKQQNIAYLSIAAFHVTPSFPKIRNFQSF